MFTTVKMSAVEKYIVVCHRFEFVCLFVYEHYNMIIVLGDPQLAKLFWAGHLP